MRCVYWNIRAGGGKRAGGIFEQLLAWQPDIIGLSEFRGTPASRQLAANLAAHGWPHQIQTISVAKRATNALLLASRFPLQQVDLPFAPAEDQRWLLAHVDYPIPFAAGVMHVPNYTSKRKYPMLDAVEKVAAKWPFGRCLLGGDTNSGKRGIDEENDSGAFFQREHDFMEAMEAKDWVDALRHLHGDERVYTWYSHRNNGFRLDQLFVNPMLQPALKSIQHIWGHNP
ncbi:MAG: endonuclease/exonuclease/phosphatase family protein, partial [Candidatus Promineifilaceae bacterium]